MCIDACIPCCSLSAIEADASGDWKGEWGVFTILWQWEAGYTSSTISGTTYLILCNQEYKTLHGGSPCYHRRLPHCIWHSGTSELSLNISWTRIMTEYCTGGLVDTQDQREGWRRCVYKTMVMGSWLHFLRHLWDHLSNPVLSIIQDAAWRVAMLS
jgi:hypothetical protein